MDSLSVPKSYKLNSGYEMPTVGLGTWTIWKNPEGEMESAISAAVKAGYRHIDTAKVYGTEPMIGSALKALIEQGEVKRSELFITCKIWCTDHAAESVKKSVQQSLKDLQTTYIDLVLIHWPMAYKHGDDLFPKNDAGQLIYADDDYVDTWKALEHCVEQGWIRSIGLSNFNIEQIERVLSIAKIPPVNHQIELNAYHLNQKVADYCKKKGILVSCYAPFGNPGRVWAKEGEPNIFEDPVVKEISERMNRSPAQICLRFLMQKGYVVLPKSVTESRIQANIQVFDFSLSAEDMSSLDKLNRNLRVYAEPIAKDSPFYPFKDEIKISESV